MNKSQIADRLAGRMGFTRSAGAVDAVFETIGEALAGPNVRTAFDCGPPASDAVLDLCTAPALQPFGPILGGRSDEGVGDGMD